MVPGLRPFRHTDVVFATITGALPDVGGDEAASVAWCVEVQVGSGLEPIVDGRGVSVTGTEDDIVERWRATASLTEFAVKQALPGPYTVGHRTTAARGDRGATTMAAAERLARDLRRLVEAGCPIVEIEEPDAVLIGTDEAERGLFRDAHRTLLETVAGAHVSLAIVGGDATPAGERTFFELPYASYVFDLIAGPDHWRLIARAPRERGIVCAALDADADAADDLALLVWALQ